MAIAEILKTKKECFIVFENGYIRMTKGKYTPSEAPIYDIYSKPPKPESGPIDLVVGNIWGQVICRENKDIWNWRLECEHIDRMNEEEHKKQKKAFKKHLIEVRRNYRRQEAERSRTEKSERAQLVGRKRVGVIAYITQLLQRQK